MSYYSEKLLILKFCSFYILKDKRKTVIFMEESVNKDSIKNETLNLRKKWSFLINYFLEVKYRIYLLKSDSFREINFFF